jgi:NADPH:quinone reductase-like Zn-dependent oxidoreductase
VTGTHSWGGNGEYLRIPARFVLRDPSDLPSVQVAAMPLVMMTAVHAVQTLGQVKSGSSVLVQAGASGSGSACVQVAKLLGAKVAATIGSDEKAETARGIGADLVVNHRRESFADKVLDWTDGVGVDVVIDNVGASVFADNLRALRLGGALVTFGLVGGYKTQIDLRRLFFRQHRLLGSFMGSLDEFRTGMTWVFERRVHAVVDKSYPLCEAAEAHRYIESRAVRGKAVLVPS